jgi:hypothetical protein
MEVKQAGAAPAAQNRERVLAPGARLLNLFQRRDGAVELLESPVEVGKGRCGVVQLHVCLRVLRDPRQDRACQRKQG